MKNSKLNSMAKDPAVLFYTSDFLTGTSFFTMEQKGQYITLLCQQHQLYSIPKNHMINICRSLDSPVIKKFVKDNDGNYYNKRMRDEAEKRKKYCESRSNNKSGRKKDKKDKSYDKSSDLHMENENENEDINKNEIDVIIEIPYNTFIKYEFDEVIGKMRCDRILNTSMQ